MNYCNFVILFIFMSCSNSKECGSGNICSKMPKSDAKILNRDVESKSRMGRIGKYLGAGALGLLSFWIASDYGKIESSGDRGQISDQFDLSPDELHSSENEFRLSRRNDMPIDFSEGILGKMNCSIGEQEVVYEGSKYFDVMAKDDFYAIYRKDWPKQAGDGWVYSDINFFDSPVKGDQAQRFNGHKHSFSSFAPLSENRLVFAKCVKEESGCSFHLSDGILANEQLSSKRDFSSANIPGCLCDEDNQYIHLVDVGNDKIVALWSGSKTRTENIVDGRLYLSSIDLGETSPSLSTSVLGSTTGTVLSAKLLKGSNYVLANVLTSVQTLLLVNLDSSSISDQAINPAGTSSFVSPLYTFDNMLGAVGNTNNFFPIEIRGESIILGNAQNSVGMEFILNVKGTKDGLVKLSSAEKGISWKFFDSVLQLEDEGEILLEDGEIKSFTWDCLDMLTNCIIFYQHDGNKQMREIFFTKKKH